jgi:hypothetical protein
MKLQLNVTKTTILASKAGPFTNLTESAKRVLLIFAQEGHDPYTRRDVYAVLTAMGGPKEFDSNDPETGLPAWQTLNFIRGMRAGGRGYYTQGDKVGARAPMTPGLAQSQEGLTVHRAAGLIWLPPSVDGNKESEGWYANDVGLRRQAAAATSCFGGYQSKASACEECPLARWCSEAAIGTMSDLAAQLDRKTEDGIVKAAEAMLAANVPAPDPELDLSESLGTAASEPATKWPEGYNEVDLPFQGVCSKCDKTIAKGETAVHVPVVGMLHPACATQALAESAS